MARPKIIGVYIIWNTVNHKVYVGSSRNMLWRFWAHKHSLRLNKHRSKHLQSAWNKYGEHVFIFEAICTCALEECYSIESEFIVGLNSNMKEYGYNTAIPVKGDEPSQAMSEVSKASWQDPKTGNNRRKGIKKKWQDQEFRDRKIAGLVVAREIAHARWDDPEFCAEQGAIRSAKWDNPEWRAAREKELKIKTAKAHTPEAKAKRKATLKALWADPEFRAKQMTRLRRNAEAMTRARVAKRAASKEIV